MNYVYRGLSTSKMVISFSLQKIGKPAAITGFSSSLGDKPCLRKAGRISVFPSLLNWLFSFIFSSILNFFLRRGSICLGFC